MNLRKRSQKKSLMLVSVENLVLFVIQPRNQREVACMDVRREEQGDLGHPWILKFDIFLLYF